MTGGDDDMTPVKISEKGIIEFYGNKAGFVKDRAAYIDTMFDRPELTEVLEQSYSFAVKSMDGIYDRLASGNEVQTELLKLCRIYQLKPNVDIRMKFISLNDMERLGFGKPNIKNYNIVYDGNIETNDLDEIYGKLYIDTEVDGYSGHAMAMSDIIELYDDSGSDFYYVDKGGYTQICFNDNEPEPDTSFSEEKENTVISEEENKPEEKVVFKFTM